MSIFLFSTRICFGCSQKSIGIWTRSVWNNIGECYTVVLKKSPTIFISPFLNCLGNGNCNSSSEKRLRNPKTITGSYLDLQLLIFGKKWIVSRDPVPSKDRTISWCTCSSPFIFQMSVLEGKIEKSLLRPSSRYIIIETFFKKMQLLAKYFFALCMHSYIRRTDGWAALLKAEESF